MKHSFKTLLTLALALVAGNAWGEKITTIAGITSGKQYYIGATTSSTDYYFYVDGTAATASIKGVAKTDVADAVALKFTAVTGGWTIQFGSGNYLGLKNGKDNGAVQVVEDAVVWTIEEDADKGLLKLHPNDYYLQKNNSGTQFGSYKATQTNVWLEEASNVPAKVLESIAISGTPTQKTYEVGDKFNPAGLVVTGTYSDKTTDNLTEKVEWTITPATFTATTETSVSVTAKVGTISSAAFNVTGLTVSEHVITPGTYDIVPNNTFYGTTNTYSGGSSTNPASLTGKKNDIEITYSKGSQQNFYVNETQTRAYSGSTLTFSVPAGYAITAIAFTADGINWEGTHTASAGSMTDNKNWAGEAQEVTITFGGTCRIASISVTFAVSSKTLTSVAVSGTPTKTSYKEGDAFDPAGLVVTGTYDDASTDDTMASQAAWSCTPATLTEGTTSVTVTATVNGVTSDAYVVNGIMVEAFVQTYANTYTSNVELSADGGTSASGAKVVIDETQYDAIKAGTGSVQGACVVTIPAGTKTLHFHAAAWKGETVTLDVNGTSYTLTSDTGVSSTSPFTLANDPETEDYFTFAPNGATTITFTASSGKRFVLFGVNAEQGSQTKSYDATITSAGFATLYLDFAAAIPTGVTAYTAVAAEDAVTLTEIEDVIPAETAVVLEGAAGTYTFKEATTTAAAPANDLVGTLTATDWATVNNGQYIYVLGQKDGVVGFYKLSETGTIKANSAYLALDEDPASGSIIIRKGDATAISLVQENGGEAVIYDLLGRRVSEPMRGIYIVNGKKMFIK